MHHVRVTAQVIRDDTGVKLAIPVILINQNDQLQPLKPLIDYLIENYDARSRSWMVKLCQAVEMLLDYTAINHPYFDKPEDLFKAFSQRVYSGTIGEDGKDPSGLYWFPKSTKTARQLLNGLSEFSEWMHDELGVQPLNPWREATSYEQRLNWAAAIQKSKKSFLGHLDSRTKISTAAKQARQIRHRRIPSGDPGNTKAFPDDQFMKLLLVGFTVPGKDDHPDLVERYDWRGICITILMHWGGLRVSEPFHLWVHDVMTHPLRVGEALVRVYHPIDGAAPKDFKGANKKDLPNREAYLKARHPGYRPRNKETGTRFAGWKNPRLDNAEEGFMHVHWLPTGVAPRLFLHAWKLYMYQRMRAGLGADRHPFLFVSFRDEQRGEPYTIDSFRDAHKRAIRRIGLIPRKRYGTTHHGHRHAYGKRTARGGVSDLVTQKGLHHNSIESQQVYKEPMIDEVTRILERATEALAAGETLPMVNEFDGLMLAERSEERHYQNKRRRQ